MSASARTKPGTLTGVAWCLLSLALAGTGCVRASSDLVLLGPAVSAPGELAAVPTQARQVGETPSTASDSEGSEDEEFIDPFARPVEATYDPLESLNVRVFAFNRKFDRYVLQPVAKAWDFILPDAVELGLRNFFRNVRFVPRFVNNLLQAKFKGAGLEVTRFVINTTFGLAGFFDPATNLFDLTTPDEDFGQTLGAYGVPHGPYLILPLLPPLTLRDATGFLFVDLALDPINYIVFPVMPYRIAGTPELTSGTATIAGWWATRVTEVVNERSISLETTEAIEDATVDFYGAVRDGYLQRRAQDVAE